MTTVQADGIAWPVETFIASHRFVEIDGTPPDFATHPCRLDVLLHDGTLQLDRFAPDLDWSLVRAVGVPLTSNDFVNCEGCGWIIPAWILTAKRGEKQVLLIERDGCSRCGEGDWGDDEY